MKEKDFICEKIMLIVFVLIMFFCFILSKITKQETQNTETREIKSCILNSKIEEETNESFVLGVDGDFRTNTNINYYIYIKGSEGFRLQKINAEHVELVFTNKIEPCIKGVFKDNGSIYSSIIDTLDEGTSNEMADSVIEYILYVPENTIQKSYSIDLEENI